MRILQFSTHDMLGGAARAASRVHVALRNAGHPSQMVVRYEQSHDPDVHQTARISGWRSRLRTLKRLVLRPWEHVPIVTGGYTFNLDVEPHIDTGLFYGYRQGAVDIICLHWITGLLTVAEIRKLHAHYRCPLIRVMMDQEPVTGGCHYSHGCNGFTRQCGDCPQLSSSELDDRSRIVWRRKLKYLTDLPIVFVAPTTWCLDRLRESSLFRDHQVELIPLPIDTTVFRPYDQHVARDLLHVEQGKKVVLFANYSLEDGRKGMNYLAEAFHRLSLMLTDADGTLPRDDVLLLSVGLDRDGFSSALPFATRQLGYLQDDITLALAYQAADVFVCPSIHDAGPMMIPESMLCGTPVVAFKTGGAPDLIETMKTGYLAAHRDSADLAEGVWRLLTEGNATATRAAARAVAARKHTPSAVARQYLELYSALLDRRQASRDDAGTL